MLKKAAPLLAITYSIALATVSLMNLSGMPKVELNYGDKIFHFIAYAILCLLWYLVFFYRMDHSYKKAILNAVLLAIIFGIILEVLQGTLTIHRSLDVYDAIANSLGALLMGSLLWVKGKMQVKN
ncbi:VanZ family protein [Hyunsoonleella jejuensis]|uniref:VanZ family protein n=1 Tax=Hyunsoonleella jejuensis TaxID=419940 RepID=UPI001FE1C6CE|nr:VanZ family protein [Hyunsoonleella jejuensis]